MSLGAARVKTEPACAVTEQVCIKEEPEMTELGWIDIELEHVRTKEESVCGQQEAARAEEEPMCVLQEAVCVKDERVGAGVGRMAARVKEEPPWAHCAGAGPGHEFKIEIPPLPPAETRDVAANMLVRDCWVRVERCAVPREVARRAAAAAASGRRSAAARRAAEARRGLSDEHEREIALKQLSGLLIRPINKNKKAKLRYTCEICKYGFKYLADLMVHKEVHMRNKRMKRKIIRLARTPSSLLSLGAPRAASGPLRPGDSYACEVCSAAFNDFDTFKGHALSHANQRVLYACDVCSKQCATRSSLKQHKRYHEVSWSFVCDNCQKRFRRSCDLVKHKAARRREKKGFCKECEAKQALKQLGNLLTSELLPSQDNTDFCESCSKMVPGPLICN